MINLNHYITIIKTAIIAIILVTSFACRQHHSPKPRGYFRIDFPKRSYQSFDSTFPYKFEYPKYARVSIDSSLNSENYWCNVEFPEFNGQIHMSYKDINNNFYELIEDSRKLAYKHTIKADAINERLFEDQTKQVIGILYDIKGDAASPIQFFATDSVHHFLRGSLYFNTLPNKDSLAPVIDFVKEDIVHLIESLEWKKN